MDLSSLFQGIVQQFIAAVDWVLVIAIILFTIALRTVLNKYKIKMSDRTCRTVVLIAGVACAFLKADYKDPPLQEIEDLVKGGFAYGGSATLAYLLLLKDIGKKLNQSDSSNEPTAPPDQGIVG